MTRVLNVSMYGLDRAMPKLRKFVADLGEDLCEGEPSDDTIRQAFLAAVQREVNSMVDDPVSYLQQGAHYEPFEEALLESMGENQ